VLGLGSVVARWGFWVLLGYGWAWGGIRPKGVAVYLVVWLGLRVASWQVPGAGAYLFDACVAALDVTLVLSIVKRDPRIG
jgi:hypothetical protein